ncbi:MAG: DNA methyltransferase [Calditrichia bacterium]
MALKQHLESFSLNPQQQLFAGTERQTTVETIEIGGKQYPKYINEFWTARQRQASSLHEIAYRACFKAQLPRFFIELLTREKEVVYDPFSGRGTTIVEAALLNRNVISNDINPLAKILAAPRLFIPTLLEIEQRLKKIPFDSATRAEIDLSMFYHPQTEAEILSLKRYLNARRESGREDAVDSWIRMVATNRLTGHSPGFFSVYTLPPNQAVSPQNQRKINEKRNQVCPYRNTRALILKKSGSLLRGISQAQRQQLAEAGKHAVFLTKDARNTGDIADSAVQLTVTSPPFLNVVQYADDNWLRCWFNNIEVKAVEEKITISSTLEDWRRVMAAVFKELYRITRSGGWVTFEVGEVRNGKIKLDESVVPLGVEAGFHCEGIVINQQTFTKTSNIWGIRNNRKGTNSNRIVLFYKE